MSTEALPRHRQLGLTDWEAERIPELLGREPTDPELVMFSLMWSEHCSYKHSKPLLRGFPTTSFAGVTSIGRSSCLKNKSLGDSAMRSASSGIFSRTSTQRAASSTFGSVKVEFGANSGKVRCRKYPRSSCGASLW